MQEVSGYLAPQVAAIYLLAILWSRTTEKGAFWGLMAGFTLGIIRMGLSMGLVPLQRNVCAVQPQQRSAIARSTFISLHYMYFAIILFSLTLMLTVLISLCTQSTSEMDMSVTTYFGIQRSQELKRRFIKMERRRGHEEVKEEGGVTDMEDAEDGGHGSSSWNERRRKARQLYAWLSHRTSLWGRRQIGEQEEEMTRDDPLAKSAGEKIVLRIGLGKILSIAIVSYLLWSLWDPK